ncbi:MAG: restriction endonuclease subunit S [Planctomycetota bacterium]|nr:restriction endonuclease subunit S [Planctomycetota bacterium]
MINIVGPPLGKVSIVPSDHPEWNVNQAIVLFRPDDRVSNKYLAFALLTNSVIRRITSRAKATAGQHNIGVGMCRSLLPIPIAPSSEQRRIVAKIEELFSDLDAGVAALKRVKAKLKRYRAAVLKAAVEGRLTEQWRAAHPATELASKLLERILTERRSKWEAEQLKAFARAGKNPPANWKDKYREPAGPDDSNLPPLSEGWCWARMRQVGAVQLGRQRSPKHHTGPHMRPYLRVANVFEDRIDTTDVMQMNFTPAEYETYRLKPGDVLLNEGQSLELIGRPAIYRDEVPGACFTNTLVRFQAHAGIDREFALAVFLTYLKNGRFQKIATITVNIAHLGAGRFAELEFPVPPLCEQRQIVAEINRQISLLNAIDATTDASLRRAARLRQSILKRAFEGKLVPQDPHDEPASVLLERIKTAAAASDTIKADCKSAAKRLRRFATTTTKEIEP